MKSIAPVLLLFASVAANADWARASAGYSCNPTEFTIQAVVKSSSGNVPLPHRFRNVRVGSHTLVCNMRGASVSARVTRVPPRETGYCAAVGSAYLRDIRINGKIYVPEGGVFVNHCALEPSFTRIEVHAQDKSLTICKGAWNWGENFEEEKCETSFVRPGGA
jgi:hypothetical protein